ncbi:MAG: homocysteine S-methyltransferase family protein, partial [Candidatus Binatia bacterium]
MPWSRRSLQLKELLTERILFLDGAMGTTLQQRELSAEDFGGKAFEGCNENLLRTRPDLVAEVHRDFLLAGADIVETNTFGSTALVLAEYGLAQRAREINRLGAEVARRV